MILLAEVNEFIQLNYNSAACFLGYGNFYQDVPRIQHIGTRRHTKGLGLFLKFLGWKEDRTIINPVIMASNFRFDL